MRNYFKLRHEERAAVVREMLNQQSLVVFPNMTAKQREWIHRAIAVADGESYAVPRKLRHMVRPPRRPL